MSSNRSILIAAAFIGISVLACNIPRAAIQTPIARLNPAPAQPTTQNPATTLPEPTLVALQTMEALTPAAAQTMIALTPVPTGPTPTGTRGPSRESTIVATTLCWAGPGSQYEVVSTVRAGYRVAVLGIGSIPGWYVIRNPIYRDPCWIPANTVQVNPLVNPNTFQVYQVPPTPGQPVTSTPQAAATP